MFFNQPLSTRFGTELSNALRSGRWSRLDIAVAWARASGLAHLYGPIKEFLEAGGELSVVVGVDLENTSLEGLRGLLAFQELGNAKSHVYHNEAGTIFHPKLYLLRGEAVDARLIIGSNNLTEAGLYRNTEAGLQIDRPETDSLIVSVDTAFQSWRDVTTGLSSELTADLIDLLHENGYVKSEAVIRKESAARRTRSRKDEKKLAKLFRSVPVGAPRQPVDLENSTWNEGGEKAGSGPSGAAGAVPIKSDTPDPAHAVEPAPSDTKPPSDSSTGNVVLMRLRKAHATDRPTQTQIPKALADSPFFSGAVKFVSSHSGEIHEVHPAMARGIVNTLKLEIPEMRELEDPVVRFERTDDEMRYEVYDSSSPQGKLIREALEQGRKAGVRNPTRLTLPRNPGRATWWRFT